MVGRHCDSHFTDSTAGSRSRGTSLGVLCDWNPACLTPEAVFTTAMRHTSRAVGLEAQVGQCGSTFIEAEGKAGTFHGRTPRGDSPGPRVGLPHGQMGCESLVLRHWLEGRLPGTSRAGVMMLEVWRWFPQCEIMRKIWRQVWSGNQPATHSHHSSQF